MSLLPVKVFATSGSEGLAQEVCNALYSRLPRECQPTKPVQLSTVTVERFSNDNLQVQVENVRGHFVVVIHTQVPPVNDHLIELFALLDAIINAGPADILLVFPYMPYGRSDNKNNPRISVMGCRLPHIFTHSFGIKRVILLDPHDSHIKHYFDPAADEISAIYLMVDFLERKIFSTRSKKDSVLVFSDAGSARRYGKVANLLNLPEVYASKERLDDKENPTLKKIVGDVRGKFCLLIDDEILTGSTAVKDAEMLVREGATYVYMLAIHAILASKGLSDRELIKKLNRSPVENFVVTNSVPVSHKLIDPSKFIVLSIAPLLAEAIKRTVLDESLTQLHQLSNVDLYRTS